ncbi:internal scaffolding protein [Sigmofec virus UA08Rod_5594]|uniref:Internal scaffolding protein n=1 Tax=Sigmofec virus UA08Rod_5594 TaxID=2929430 RepID=A0A976R7C0_9VIRU|nr:internal scaffolding protein [Sigmofec virus UA08Rod_5594]
MIDIRSQYDRLSPARKIDPGASEPGSEYKVTYSSYYDSEGRLIVEASGKVNLYEEIQSHKDSTDIHILLDRYHKGDLDVMARLQEDRGVYADVTGMPRTYAEVLNLVHQGELEFMRLPVDVRAKFDHSYEVYMASMDDPKVWSQRMGFDAAETQARQINEVSPQISSAGSVNLTDVSGGDS